MLRTLSCAVLLASLLAAVPVRAQHPDDAFVGQMAPPLKTGEWINSEPLTLEELRGKVVLIKFWAWDCPECAESMPHVLALHDKYAEAGLVVIGVHTPRAEYEKDAAKVRETVAARRVTYPVTLDHEYLTWLDYLGNAWPTHFIVDQQGVIQLSHTGTGRYEETEEVVQRLLGASR